MLHDLSDGTNSVSVSFDGRKFGLHFRGDSKEYPAFKAGMKTFIRMAGHILDLTTRAARGGRGTVRLVLPQEGTGLVTRIEMPLEDADRLVGMMLDRVEFVAAEARKLPRLAKHTASA